jgi:hypothetical protein
LLLLAAVAAVVKMLVAEVVLVDILLAQDIQ